MGTPASRARAPPTLSTPRAPAHLARARPCSQTPSAEPRDIKRAYHSLMREFHPDRAPEGLRDGMADLCVLLNEIYAVGGWVGAADGSSRS